MKLILILAYFLIVSSANAQTTPQVWQAYSVKDEKFSVALPARPVCDYQKILPQGLGKGRVEINLGAYADGVVYTVYVLETVHESWKRYTAEDRDFSVMMPKVPVLTLSKNTAEPKRRQQESLKASVDNVTYSVLTSENPKPRLGLEEFIKEQLIRGWDPGSERRVTVNGIPGKEYLSKDRNLVAQFFVTDKSLYRFLTKGAPADDPRVKQFFSSIELGERLAGTSVKPEAGVVYYFQDEPDVFKGKDVDRRVQVLAKPEPVAVAGPPEEGGSKFSVILGRFSLTMGT